MLRKRKNKRYNEEANDDEEDGGRLYNIKDKIRSERFEVIGDLQELPGDQVTLKLFQKNGFDKPILVNSPSGLDIVVPPEGFVVRDVGKFVGYDRVIDVMDVGTQKNIEMTMKDWCKYYESRHRSKLLNVISLEFSHTDLDELVGSPKVVKLLDWVDLVWPKFLKESQTESTNTINKMKYPKVQKYCLMSVKGSYTDFHIDFGGTSVWYHIIRGKKIFWMVPPTELNLQTFEEWTLSGMQQDVFFGDTVEECFRVELSAGNTFFIPSGWIHAVYTVEDSLVFGGNFLHSFGIENQLKISRIEDATKVPLKFRYPFYTEILWYVVQHYVYCLTGRSHLHDSPKNSTNTTPEKKATTSQQKRAERVTTYDDSSTESDQEVSDKTKRKKTATTKQSPPKRKRGRPPKKKAPTPSPLDEDTDIYCSGSDEEKQTKSATTCRMTKNSLLRLQYEIDTEPKVTKSSSKSSESSSKPKQETTASKAEPKSPKTIPDAKKSSVPNSMDDDTKAPLNGWSLNNTEPNKVIWSNPDVEPKEPFRIHLTRYELNGLKLLVKYLSKLSGAKKNLPTLIRNSRALLDDCKKVIAEHENDDPEMAVTGVPITPDLLLPKKSDLNRLIDQFFKPTDASHSDDSSHNKSTIPSMSRSDSTTLTMQQRLKYIQNNNYIKLADDKKPSGTTAKDGSPSKLSSQKEPKSSVSPTKKSSNSSASPSLSAAPTNATLSSPADIPRPKSPPTRPLSNKQYSSRTKGDKNDNQIMPGLFADLIAKTSSAKEVFDVSGADLASSLFGLKSPTKNASNTVGAAAAAIAKSTDPSNSNNSTQPTKRSPFDIDIEAATTSTSSATKESQKDTSTNKPSNSPEPPKLTPNKRFINPALNKPLVKEKLIFASAPYVSPVHASENSRQPYPWQSSTPIQVPHNHQQHQAFRRQTQVQGHDTPSRHSTSPTSPVIAAHPTVSGRPSCEHSETEHPDATKKQQTNESNHDRRDSAEVSQEKVITRNDEKSQLGGAVLKREKQDEAIGCHDVDSVIAVSPIVEKNTVQGAAAGASNFLNRSLNQSSAATITEQKPEKQQTKPRGPPKKSMEARQAIVSSPQQCDRQIMPETVIKFNIDAKVPINHAQNPAQSSPPTQQSHKQPSPSSRDLAPELQTDTSKPKVTKAKRPKKEKKSSQQAVDIPTTTSQQPSNNVHQAHQSRPPVICGLVAPPVTSAPSSAHTNPQAIPRPGQQYYIAPLSRPAFYANQQMPPLSVAHAPRMTSAAPMPFFTTSLPATMGLQSMQPGARIVWATRPPVSSNTSTTVPRSSPVTLQAKTSISSKPSSAASPLNLQSRQSGADALLSLATTALSTAPLPTTPTMSNVNSRLTHPTHAFMLNPRIPQPFFNPYGQPMPLLANGQPHPAMMTAAAAAARSQMRPMDLTPSPAHGQLLLAPMPTGQPRYFLTQGFMPPNPYGLPLYAGHHQSATTLAYPSFPPTLTPRSTSSAKESAKAKKVRTR